MNPLNPIDENLLRYGAKILIEHGNTGLAEHLTRWVNLKKAAENVPIPYQLAKGD